MNTLLPTTLGTLLRQWRRSRKMSLECTAQQSGVTRVTLQRWETGKFWPRLPELRAVLYALETTPQQRRQALALLEAPRATVRLRQEIARETGIPSLDATGAGGLLRALRLRKQMTLEATARRAGVHKSTLTRWERGEAWPTPEHLHTLCHVLEASTPELAALTEGPGGFVPEETTTVEALRAELRRVCMLAPHDPEEALKDLLFLRLEARVWLQSTRPEYALLLADVRAAYAGFLAGVERYAEALPWADRALEQTAPHLGSIWWMHAALAQGQCEVFRGKRPAPQRGLEVLRAWLPELSRPDFVAWALRDMAEYAFLANDVEAALDLSAQSCQVVEAEGPRNEVFVRQCDRASLLLRANLPRQALTAVPAEIDRVYDWPLGVTLYPDHRMRMTLLRVQALHALGDVNAAHGWLQCAYAGLEAGYLNPRLQFKFRNQMDRLARQF